MRKKATKPQKPAVIKICKECGHEKPHHWMNTLKTYRHRCHDCHSEYNRQYRHNTQNKKRRTELIRNNKQATKKYLVNLLGGKCQKCGLKDECPAIYDFHHRDPKVKDKTVSFTHAEYVSARIKREIKKCDLLCSNCHRRIHWEQKNPPASIKG